VEWMMWCRARFKIREVRKTSMRVLLDCSIAHMAEYMDDCSS
jgi:hypothetical protein